MAKRKKKQEPERVFVALKSIGTMVGPRSFPAMEFRGRHIADDKRPLCSLVVPIIRDITALMRYDSEEQFNEDFATLKQYLDGFKWTPPKEASEA